MVEAPFFPFNFFSGGNHCSSVIVQSPQGCSCVVGMEQCCILAKNIFQCPLSEFSGSAPVNITCFVNYQ